jgi:hypothetical protein
MQLALDEKLGTLFERPELEGELEAMVLGASSNLSHTLQEIRAENGVDLSRARIRAGFARGHLLDVVVHSAHFSNGGAARAGGAAEKLVCGILGERIANDWVGRIEVTAEPRKGGPLRVLNNDPDAERAFPVNDFAPAVAAAVRGLYVGLPDRHCWAEGTASDWTLFELEPETADDYGAQDDLVLATSMRPEMLKCFLQGMPFCSERFSRHHEVFCYLKYQSETASPEERLSERNRFEDALGSRLASNKLGAVVGNGLGMRYTYIDLALTDPALGLESLERLARTIRLPEKSWLLFCESDWRQHWFAIGKNAGIPHGLR